MLCWGSYIFLPIFMDLTFWDAMRHCMEGVRMAAKFLPSNVFIELQKPDAHSMNTEPYLKMVTVDDAFPVEGTSETVRKVVRCEPWHPGTRSFFSKEWGTSNYQGVVLQ